jgi:hypothetical protein
MLQSKAGYIEARSLTASSAKSSCYARPDHTLGQARRATGPDLLYSAPKGGPAL